MHMQVQDDELLLSCTVQWILSTPVNTILYTIVKYKYTVAYLFIECQGRGHAMSYCHTVSAITLREDNWIATHQFTHRARYKRTDRQTRANWFCHVILIQSNHKVYIARTQLCLRTWNVPSRALTRYRDGICHRVGASANKIISTCTQSIVTEPD